MSVRTPVGAGSFRLYAGLQEQVSGPCPQSCMQGSRQRYWNS